MRKLPSKRISRAPRLPGALAGPLRRLRAPRVARLGSCWALQERNLRMATEVPVRGQLSVKR